MAYKLITTKEMECLLDQSINYLLVKLKNEQAARHLLACVEQIYTQLEDNPYIYRESQDPFMHPLHYREAKIPGMDYLIVYKVADPNVYLLGIFNTREEYSNKMKVIWNFSLK